MNTKPQIEPEQATQQDNWIWHKDAAALMCVNEKYLRMKDQNGFYRYWPQLDRIQPVPKGRIFLRRDQIAAWRQQQEQAAAQNKPPEMQSGNIYEGLREEFMARGWTNTLRKLGVRV